MYAIEKDFYTNLMVSLLVIGGILLFFLLSIIRQQTRYKRLSQAKINAEIATLEKERKRIASDLHDEIGPMLSTIKLQINHIDIENEEDKLLIVKTNRYIDDVIQKMREISYNLLPNILIRRGLTPAIIEFIDKVKDSTPIQISLKSSLSGRLDIDLEVNIYRLVQEIIHNSIKHSKANRLVMELGMESSIIRLATADDGIGFDFAHSMANKSGLGLFNLQSRTDVMEGVFNIDSQKGKGTRFLFEIPFKAKA